MIVMRRHLCLIAALLLICTNVVFAVPSWVKPGLVVVYNYEGGAATRSYGSPGSGSYGRGYMIFIVHSVSYQKACGLHITLFGGVSSPLVLYNSQVECFDIRQNLSFFVNPNMAAQWLKQRPPVGCKVAGVPGQVALECQRVGEINRVVITYDTRTGLIKETVTGATQYQGGWSSTQASLRFLKMLSISLPNVKAPSIALTSHTYQLYSATVMGTVPSGQISVTYVGREKNLFVYNIQTPAGLQKAYGNRYTGPFYIHPALLKRRVILSIPEIGFSIVTDGVGSRGGVVVNHIWNQQIISQTEIDPSTGLLLYQQQPVAGMGYQILQLTQ
ncbi:hypothetical protein TST_0046 [Thermosulfidibacter takaii ABI70S6]|uniref:Uncharacterized protein n=1 Tax=Thermosulfidibacter takaii (strain DSM 17441 / JCM 13301 / NBRC 103674 / ABI70S6) TaxID=1298851 RepID=A0A0S3QR83_THET7|nr:hypothetical protein TST_0046 [Thermosulfidibacter takaii ABI70S6]